ncbi:hypothetical protein [Terriglobus roseus]|uniref:Uncharacterized protein n=1 Tax=Terriglobus roseus TaxID=392734 RepID=A0A1H4K854_9BACT|nr:hypothetical protein [Terriglobus roseus]SEB54228.1 hypothetical protein SAMN05443244_1038 [Terriglobus roseus]
MINSKAVAAHLKELGDWTDGDGGSAARSASAWFQDQLQQLTFEHHCDETGNTWITVPGKSDQAVVLGSLLNQGSDTLLQHHVGLVSGLEILKAVAQRNHGLPPCTLQLVAWSSPSGMGLDPDRSTSAVLGEKAAAYLELHFTDEADAKQASSLDAQQTRRDTLDRRLMALCDEAVREMTGAPASLPLREETIETDDSHVPTGVMFFPGPVPSIGQEALHLHLLQASEAFGRWAESTMHLVVGEELDLWAREQRIPRT